MSVFADIGLMIPDIRHPDIGMIPTILIPISGHSDIWYQSSDIGHFISNIRYNIGYNVGYPDIGTMSDIPISRYRVKYPVSRYWGMVTAISGTISDTISDIPISGYQYRI
jgi:hypothetical protein